jgi:hypothetical protein
LHFLKPKKDRVIHLPENYWFFAITAAPDFNGVASVTNSRVALNLGAQIGYNLSDRWKLTTGINYGPKIYQASGTDYWNSAFPRVNNPIQWVNANCKVWDIPLEIGYSFYKKDRSQFYINLGISTYFLRQETYTYNYWAVNKGNANDNASTPPNNTFNLFNKNKNILGVLDFVLDYRYRLNNRSSFGLSPYLKLPLRGVGQGKLDLISFGTTLSINYNFGKPH